MNTDTDIRVVQIQASVHTDQGGLATFTAALCDALVDGGVNTDLVTRPLKEGSRVAILPSNRRVGIYYLDRTKGWRGFSFFDRSFSYSLRSICIRNHIDLLHTQDLWTPEVHLATRCAQELKLPYVMSITGTLTPWALKFKVWKKRIGWRLYQFSDLQNAAVLHAASPEEAGNIRTLGLKNPIALVPLAIKMPPKKSFKDKNRQLRTALYISRIHRKKGLIHLIEAWETLRPKGWRVIIAGQDDDGFRGEIENAIKQKGMEDLFLFQGFISEEKKWELYREADIFILPSYSENFGLVILEALASGLPVITTTGTPWKELPTHRCGWWIEIGTVPLITALREAISLPDAERARMGIRGRHLVEKLYSFSRLGKEMKSVYRWVLTGGSPPSCLRFD